MLSEKKTRNSTNYFATVPYVSNDRTDYNTLILVIEKHKKAFGDILEEVTADNGYSSEKNLLYLKEKKYPVTSSYRIMKSAKHVLTQKILGSIITWKHRYSRMNCIIFVMMEENCIISAQKAKNRSVIHRPLRCMDVQTAAAVNQCHQLKEKFYEHLPLGIRQRSTYQKWRWYFRLKYDL